MEHELVGVMRRGVLAASLLLLLVPLVTLSVAVLVKPARPRAVLVLSALLEAEEAALESLLPQQSEKSSQAPSGGQSKLRDRRKEAATEDSHRWTKLK